MCGGVVPFLSRSSSAIVKNAPTKRCLNSGIKETMRKFIMENPLLAVNTSSSLNLPVAKGVSRMQREMMGQIEVIDLEHNPMRIRKIRPNSKENPLIVGSNDERKVETCLCFPDVHYLRSIVLFRDLPTRCQCGHWFKLVDMERFEREREARWNDIKSEPENAKLLQEFEGILDKLNEKMTSAKSLTLKSRGSSDAMVELSALWKKLKRSYAEIRRRMELP